MTNYYMELLLNLIIKKKLLYIFYIHIYINENKEINNIKYLWIRTSYNITIWYIKLNIKIKFNWINIYIIIS